MNEVITTDMLGKDVHVGDRIAAAFRMGNQGELRVGRVSGVSSRNEYWTPPGEKWGNQNPRPTLLIDWEDDIGYRGTKSSWIYQDVKRFVVIGE